MTYRDDKLRGAQGALRLTISEIAEKAQLSTPTVSAVLNGEANVKLTTLKAVAAVLNIEMSSLFQFEEKAA